jgi:hypothetical protein
MEWVYSEIGFNVYIHVTVNEALKHVGLLKVSSKLSWRHMTGLQRTVPVTLLIPTTSLRSCTVSTCVGV